MTFLFSPIGRWLAALAVSAALIAGAYVKGHSKGYAEADQRAKVAELQTALKAAYQDLDAQRVAAEHNRRAAEENRKAVDAAERLIDDYEKELAARGPAARCLLDAADIERLSKQGIGSDFAAPSRR